MSFDLLKIKAIKALAFSRVFRPFLLLFSLASFVLLILAGFIGSPVGNNNAAIVMVWILWFALLMLVLIPFGGRMWCMVCPIPVLGEFAQRKAIVRKRNSFLNLGLSWSKSLDNIWLQNFAFISVAVFSPLILTVPKVTALALLIFISLALILDLSFRRAREGKIFCRYLCPIGGFIALYSMLGALEVRPKDREICKKCTLKTCVKGNERGYACPWLISPFALERNAYCGICLECIKSCAYANMTLNLRVPGEDLVKEKRGDEAAKSFIMLGSVIAYSTAYFGWFNELKDIINFSAAAFSYRLVLFAAFLLGTIAAIPLIMFGFAFLSNKLANAEASVKDLLIKYSYATIPLSFSAWLAFIIGMLMINGSYIISNLSDPFGFGWNLLGTANYGWRTYYSIAMPYIQGLIILAGSLFSVSALWKISSSESTEEKQKQQKIREALPMALFISLVTLGLVFIFVS